MGVNVGIEARFNEKWTGEPNTGCWLWTASTSKKGYGNFTGGKAHRMSWKLHRGPIPDGLHVLHTCDIPSCVNPQHLFLGTNTQNIAQKVARNRAQRLRGITNGNAKLTDADIIKIRTMPGTTRAIARIFGINQKQVCNIRLRRQWSHVSEE